MDLGTVGTAAMALAIGAAGWVATSFVATPIRRFWDLRGEVSRTLIAHKRFIEAGPLPLHEIMDRSTGTARLREQAANEMKKLGLDLEAFWKNEALARRFLKFGGIDANEAALWLDVLAGAIQSRGGPPDGIAELITKPLRL